MVVTRQNRNEIKIVILIFIMDMLLICLFFFIGMYLDMIFYKKYQLDMI